MLKIYGSMQCPDCVQCRKELDEAGVPYEFLEFSESLLYLKTFLQLRDGNDLFESVRREGKIGIPCIVDDAENVSLDWSEYVSQAKA
jgi:glutaredoxin-related protein